MSRQSVSEALKVIRKMMFQITGSQPPYNPTSKFQGSRVTVHGATRHTSASLLLSNKHSDEKGPSEHVILEIQQRSDARVPWKHYYHAEEEQVEAALEYAAAPSLFTKGLPEALPTEAAVPKNWCARSAQGMLFWKEVWSWTKACSKLSRLFFHWISQACCQEKDENTLLSRAVWEEKQRAQFFTGSLQQRHKLMGNFCTDIGAHGAVSGIREEHFQKKDELSKLTENSWTCCLVTEMRSSAQGGFVLQGWFNSMYLRAGCVRNDGLYLILVVGFSWIVCCPKTSAPWPETFGLGDGWGTVLGEKVVSALCLSYQLKVLKHDCFFGWPASLLTGRTGVCDVNWGDVN